MRPLGWQLAPSTLSFSYNIKFVLCYSLILVATENLNQFCVWCACLCVCVRVCVRACVAAAAALCAQGLHSSQVIYVCVCLQSCVFSHVHVGPLRCHSSLPDIHMCTKKNITGLGCQNSSACSRASSNCPQHHPSIWRTSRGEYLYCK